MQTMLVQGVTLYPTTYYAFGSRWMIVMLDNGQFRLSEVTSAPSQDTVTLRRVGDYPTLEAAVLASQNFETV